MAMWLPQSARPPQEDTDAMVDRRFLTKKVQPTCNEGRDNDDYNLIVRMHDVLEHDSSSRQERHCHCHVRREPRRYIALQLLGQGTFGQVFRCLCVETQAIMAVKVIRNHPSYNKQAVTEVEITQTLNRAYTTEQAPHIVRIDDSFQFQGHFCIVYELLGRNLYEVIVENKYRGFSLSVTQDCLRQILHAMVQLEEIGVIHCDLKPENILINGQDPLRTTDGHLLPQDDQVQLRELKQAPRLKVVDFGSACMKSDRTHSYIQSRFYRAPEVLLGVPYTGAIDMWSFGCIAVEILLGLPLFPGISEHDQLRLIQDMRGPLPQSLLRQGRNVLRYYNVRMQQGPHGNQEQFVLKSPEQFALECNKEVQSAKKSYKHSTLTEIIQSLPFRPDVAERERQYEQNQRDSFIHFISGVMSLNPENRWTAKEAIRHPFITGALFHAVSLPPLQFILQQSSGNRYAYENWSPLRSQYLPVYPQSGEKYNHSRNMTQPVTHSAKSRETDMRTCGNEFREQSWWNAEIERREWYQTYAPSGARLMQPYQPGLYQDQGYFVPAQPTSDEWDSFRRRNEMCSETIYAPLPPPQTAWETPRHQVYAQQSDRNVRSWRDRSYPLSTTSGQRYTSSGWSPTSDWRRDPRFVTPPRRPSIKSSPHRARRRRSVQSRPLDSRDMSGSTEITDLPVAEINATEPCELNNRRWNDYKSSSNSRIYNIQQKQPYHSPRNRQHSRHQNKTRNGRQNSIDSRPLERRTEGTRADNPVILVAHEEIAYV